MLDKNQNTEGTSTQNNEQPLIRVGITEGDPNGVGYELILRTFADNGMLDLCQPIIYGHPKIANYHKKALDIKIPINVTASAKDLVTGQLNLVDCLDNNDIKVEYGVSNAEAGHASFMSLERAVQDLKNGLIDVLVTAPINKANIQSDQFHFIGHTEYLQDRLGNGTNESLMILCNKQMRIALVTTHLPISEVAFAITQDLIEQKTKLLYESLIKDFNISSPRIAVLSLNPHTGEGGLLGQEEETIITPAIKSLSDAGISCYGPYAADGFFGSANYKHFDGVLAMYHDQGLAPFKALSMNDGINFTAGLPFVRTSPDHGTAYDIAGRGIANIDSFRESIFTAIDIFRNRKAYETAHKNPLPKLYQERRER